MKKVVLFLIVVLITLSTVDSMAQAKVGGFIGFGSDVDQVGVGGIGEYGITNQWSVSSSILFYLTESNSNFTRRWMEFNINANYYFYQEGIANLYGLGGINYLRSSYREKFGDERTFSSGDVGINLGIGSNFDVGKNFEPFAEVKFVLGETDQVALFFGMKFKI